MFRLSLMPLPAIVFCGHYLGNRGKLDLTNPPCGEKYYTAKKKYF